MSERIQASLSVAEADAHALQQALDHAKGAAAALSFRVVQEAPSRASLTLDGDDHDALVAAIEVIGPSFTALDGKASLQNVAFSEGVGASLKSRLGGLAQAKTK